METDTETIKRLVAPVLRKAGVNRSALFGSCARGEATKESDVDILVELPASLSLLGYVGLKNELEDVLARHVDLVEYDSIKPQLRASILTDTVDLL